MPENGTPSANEIVLKTEGLTKEFSGVPVLRGIDVSIRRGEIFGIIGENGAGKSTFIKILSGIYHPSAGKILLDGSEIELASPITARQYGISVIPQEFNLIGSLKVWENIFLGRERHRGVFLDRKVMRNEAQAILGSLEVHVPVDAPVELLSPAQKQMVEIAKALVDSCRILIMDEPLTVLTDHEVEILFSRMRRLQAEGVTILFISHRLKEVKRICDRVMVLRDGELVKVSETAALDEKAMAGLMIGRQFDQVFPPRTEGEGGDVILKVEDLAVDGLFAGVDLEVRRGEIVGLAGLVGAGRTELAESLFGVRPCNRGRILLEGREVKISSPGDALAAGIAYLSEDRQGKGLILDFTLPANISLACLADYGKIFMARQRLHQRTEEHMKRFRIKAASMHMPVRFLSGGNQQKVCLAKWMETQPRLLILDEPTRGIDVNAKLEIYQFIHSLVDAGIGCLVISSELEEIIGLCHRVYVMREGRICGCLSGESICEETIMQYATGVHKSA
ncbi:MAG: sugar ABC transporter ATP-binding protein [Lentisphaerae bacterium]|nr:MAG: sugar ABC transporter ATP-binding protein [Lentisphaerota bacterium]